ncbi:MAG: aldehyde dehydrogenase family protein [Acidaminococcus sp.]|jgi:succinate-semialdehyde dehydrogenase/glutarate-semialdehyde dehydrogenase|nr:aldehyde dehydrogenase family protein [Acidaminococcus sp.]MCI2099737.1 aldehyde dehydrogenase family protein [Acidaminococcus sp.]MCI2113993.1 aldehyde dehydrogenase family protein [Acidaminococcus sp.]MCI2116102.1 aldehyde dehydrogenase family protein [Acidaminococcus sp.]
MQMLIGGKETGASDGKTFEVLNPTTHEVIDTFPAATKEDIDTILENARKGSREWAAVPLWKRIDILKECIHAIEEHRDELGKSIVRELGVPISQVQGEINTAAARATASTEGARFINGECYPPSNCSASEEDLIVTVREPLGVVLAIIPFNFPVATFCTKVWPALLMGNAVVAKLPSDDPLTIIKVTKLMLSCGVPGNALQVVTGSGSVLGRWLNTDSRIDAISMTGSTQVGASVAVDAGKNLASCALELGGNDPLIILPDADIDYAVSQAIANRSNRSGQICHSSKRFIVHSSLKDEFTRRLVEELRKKKVGDPMDPDTVFGPVVSERAAANIEKQINLNVEEGAKVLLGGKRFNKTFIEPTVLDCPHEAEAAHSMEIFGPVWTVLSYDTVEEAIELANDTMYGLSSGVIGKDMGTMLHIAQNIQAGTCVLNGGGSYAAPYSPFGGYKKSGLGRQSAMENLKEFSQIKTIVFRHSF